MSKKPLPKSHGRITRRVSAFRGIDRREGAPFGSLKNAMGAMSSDGVTLRGAPSWEKVYTFPDTLYPQSLSAMAGGIFAMCRVMGVYDGVYIQDGELKLVAYMEDGTVLQSAPITDRIPDEEVALPSDINRPRSMAQFNVYSSEDQLSDALGGSYDKKLLIFPDKMWVDLPVKEEGFALSRMEEERGDVPDLYYVCVSGGRLFGTDEGRIYASAYNDPWNWNVDTPDDIGAENAWVTTTGADTGGDGAFTGICAYDGNVWGFKEDFGHIVSGESNPFTVKDTDAIGAIDQRAVARGDGRLFFVRADGVRMANGSTVSLISDPLCLDGFTCGISAYHEGVLYLAEGNAVYAYHVKSDTWSALPLPPKGEIISLTAGKKGVYALTQVEKWESYIYRLSGQTEEWEAELTPTDFSVDTDKGPTTLTLHADAPDGTVITVSLKENNSGKELPLGSKESTGGGMRFRTHIRGGAGHSYSVRITVKGEAVIRGVTLAARNGVKDDG